MSSILDRVLGNDGRVQGSKVKPLDVQNRIDTATAILHALQLRFAPIAFAAEEDGNEANVAALAQITSDIRNSEDRIRSLGVALVEAQRVQALAERIAQSNVWDVQVHAMAQHASAARSASVAVVNAVGVLAECYERLIGSCEKLRQAVPAGTRLDDNAIPSIPYIETLLAFEIHRLATLNAGNQTPVNGSLPGGIKPRYGNENLSLATVVAGHVDQVMITTKAQGVERFGD